MAMERSRASSRISGRKGQGFYEELKIDAVLEDEDESPLEELELNDDDVYEVERIVQKRMRRVSTVICHLA